MIELAFGIDSLLWALPLSAFLLSLTVGISWSIKVKDGDVAFISLFVGVFLAIMVGIATEGIVNVQKEQMVRKSLPTGWARLVSICEDGSLEHSIKQSAIEYFFETTTHPNLTPQQYQLVVNQIGHRDKVLKYVDVSALFEGGKGKQSEELKND
jgi:hypothetical protein